MKSTILKISEAAAIALHAADLLAAAPGPHAAKDIAKTLGVSYNHLSKVLQRLTHAGLVLPARGPKGGFTLSPAGRKALVRDFLSAMDGVPELHACLMGAKVCRHRDCMFGSFLEETNKRFEAVLNGKISEFSKRK
ncbi:MAG: Rrf2 family transcriptional regulator [Elusimicrobia bacterium]|jgi:Rrf2 family nitric oxide-sensitive transcriptional repressor|nr:Rrf2 family transcriptional regulator [Elusimicrobiota bacterium]